MSFGSNFNLRGIFIYHLPPFSFQHFVYEVLRLLHFVVCGLLSVLKYI